MKKILIGTHNKGKFKEFSNLISSKYRKISPTLLKIKSPKETGKSFSSNSKLKAKFFSKFVNYPVISDDSGLCVKALQGKPGIHSARLAKRKGSFLQAMKFILKRLKKTTAIGVDMETATVFSVGHYNEIARGALLLVSDVPLTPEGVKTETSDKEVTQKWVDLHLEIGIKAMTDIGQSGEEIKHFKY